MTLKNDEIDGCYEFLNWTTNTERAEISGEERVILHEDLFIHTLRMIEHMAKELEPVNPPMGFVRGRNGIGREEIRATKFGQRYYLAVQMFFRTQPEVEHYVFSPHVTAVLDAYSTLQLGNLPFSFEKPHEYLKPQHKTYADLFNDLIQKTAEIVKSKTFRARLRARSRNAQRNEATALALEQSVFRERGRVLVLMLHFGYAEEHRKYVSLEDIQAHRKKFFNNCRSNEMLRGIEAYIWKLEEGHSTGLHLHLLLFYTAASSRDEYIARKIGDYWRKITDGKGAYWNSNAEKARHARYGHGVGTGAINWSDDDKREALRKNIQYMTKADQFLTVRYGKRDRVFGVGSVTAKKKVGRPRKSSAS